MRDRLICSVNLFIFTYSTFWFQSRIFFKKFCSSRLAQVKRFRITSSRKATYMQEVNAACAQLSQCATRTFPLQQLRRNPGTATAASCSDAATHTKEILIAPQDGNLQIPGWENGGVCMICLETNAGKCCASAPLRWWSDPRPLCHREMSFPIKLHG